MKAALEQCIQALERVKPQAQGVLVQQDITDALRVAKFALIRRVCPMNVHCSEHGFHHGAEATELREGLEKLLQSGEDTVDAHLLQNLLDRVDARDTLAYEQNKNKDTSG